MGASKTTHDRQAEERVRAAHIKTRARRSDRCPPTWLRRVGGFLYALQPWFVSYEGVDDTRRPIARGGTEPSAPMALRHAALSAYARSNMITDSPTITLRSPSPQKPGACRPIRHRD